MFHNSWDIVLKDEMEKQYFKYIKEFVKEERLSKTIYPPAKDLFNAFKLTDFNEQSPFFSTLLIAFLIINRTKNKPTLIKNSISV